jgi:hypothetical protein
MSPRTYKFDVDFPKACDVDGMTLLALHMNKADQCKEILPTLEREFASSVTPELIRAALLQRAKQPKQCYEALEAAVAAAPAEGKKADAALLTLAQLQLQDHDLAKAIGTLKRAEGLATCPGMVGTLVALHERLGQTAEAAGCFEGVTSAPVSSADPMSRAAKPWRRWRSERWGARAWPPIAPTSPPPPRGPSSGRPAAGQCPRAARARAIPCTKT